MLFRKIVPAIAVAALTGSAFAQTQSGAYTVVNPTRLATSNPGNDYTLQIEPDLTNYRLRYAPVVAPEAVVSYGLSQQPVTEGFFKVYYAGGTTATVNAYGNYSAISKRTGGWGEGHSILEAQKLYLSLQNPATPAYTVRNERVAEPEVDANDIQPRAIIKLKPRKQSKPKIEDKMAAR